MAGGAETASQPTPAQYAASQSTSTEPAAAESTTAQSTTAQSTAAHFASAKSIPAVTAVPSANPARATVDAEALAASRGNAPDFHLKPSTARFLAHLWPVARFSVCVRAPALALGYI